MSGSVAAVSFGKIVKSRMLSLAVAAPGRGVDQIANDPCSVGMTGFPVGVGTESGL